ncbi:MAG: fused MFS/spermidine synthase [Planctomycetes bacterium]|nr:fused MFS/spermidine synthase [Planctomycetota bacterium]
MSAQRAPSAGWILGLAFASGAVALVLELSAVRLLAPWFGATSGVWTHVIGVILLALALGYLLGARLARAARPQRSLAIVFWIAAASTAWLPSLAQPVCGWFVPQGLGLDEAAGVLRWGSLAASLLLFAPPTFVLGCVAPLATEWLQREQGSSAGEAGGRILCVSTLGSLCGSFATTYFLVPGLGLTRTYLACALLLGLLAAFASLRARRAGPELAALLALAGALLGSRWERPAPGEGDRVLDERETAYQSVRVVERREQGQPTLRFLQVNEGFDSFQSAWQEAPGLLPDGYYYNAFALPPAWDTLRSGPWRTLVLGLGAGSTWRVLEGTLGEGRALEGDGVEIDPGVVELARRYMDLRETPGRRVWAGLDGRSALRSLGGDYDQLVIDAYANQVEIPPQLATLEFFEAAASHLRRGGWISANVGGFGLEDPVALALARTAARALAGRVLLLCVPFSRNLALVGRVGAELPEPGTPAFLELRNVGLARLANQVSLPGTWRFVEPGPERVLTDDLVPIERLQEASLERAAMARAEARR